MILGFIGVGNIGKAIITGLCTCSTPPEKIVIYDVDEGKCTAIGKRFRQIEIAPDNQTLLDRAECVFVCVLPQIAPQVLLPLNFREDHVVVTVIAIRPISEISEYVEPARTVIRALPLPAIADHVGPVIFYPHQDKIAQLFAGIGRDIPVSCENDLIVLSAITGLIAPYYALIAALSGWAASAGVDPHIARRYNLAMFDSLNYAAIEGGAELDELASEAATPGGLNHQALRELEKQQAFDPFLDVLDVLLQRLGLEAPSR
jgi:pyrroline-5-carboxylate reductase